MNIHISNLSLDLTEADIKVLFLEYGAVNLVTLVRDKVSNKSRGKAFVEMPVEKEGKKAIINLDGIELKGKMVAVSEIRYDNGLNSR